MKFNKRMDNNNDYSIHNGFQYSEAVQNPDDKNSYHIAQS
jgi:hypothetical protein